jgi:iron complex outermembrane receptor protein
LGQLSGPTSEGSTNPLFLTGVTGATTGGNQANLVAETNPALKPATSESWTAGIVYSPKFVPGLSLHWDYYRTRYKGYVIDSPNVASALQSVENLGPKSPYAGIVALNAAAGTPGATPITAPGQVVSGVNAGNLYITQSLANAGVLDLDGFDTGFNYESPMTDFGKFTATSDCDFYFDYRASSQEGLREYSYLGQYTSTAIDNNGQGTIPQFRFNSSLQWDYQGWTAYGNMNFTPGVEDLAELAPAIGGTFSESTANGQAYHVNSYTTFDVALSYEFGKQKMIDSKKDRPLPINECTWYDGIELTAGSKNVGDTKAPFVPSAPNDNTDLGTYDTLGRFIYFDISKKF